jgi:YVTN family beta-propeller protein
MMRGGLWALLALFAWMAQSEQVGPRGDTAVLAPNHQLVRPAGSVVRFAGRPVDLVRVSDGSRVYLKDNRGLVVLETPSWRVLQELSFPQGGGSMHGIVVSRDGRRLFLTSAQDRIWEAAVDPTADPARTVSWRRSIAVPGPAGGPSHASGLALSPDERQLYVCLSRNNSLGVVDLDSGALTREIAVGVAPFDVVIGPSGAEAWVSCWGGRRPAAGRRAAPSSGTPVSVDARGVADSGMVAVVDLPAGRMAEEIDVGLHPSDLVATGDGRRLFVANANADTVSIIDLPGRRVAATVSVRPDPDVPFGSAPNALALAQDGRTLFVANGGNNAVAVISVSGRPRVRGFIPAGWYPGALAADDRFLYIANVKGEGSRRRSDAQPGWRVSAHLGTASQVPLPDPRTLARFSRQVRADARVPEALRAWERAALPSRVGPVPVPERLGEPSVFEHVVYVIKENRTYDQVFGDLPRGNGDASLCDYGREVTPNHHALAEEFVLLDNFYCNGVLSADGHSWATEGNVTDHLEKAFGGFTRSYTFGDDPLTYSASGFIWDNVLDHGLSFRNYGEMDYAEPVPANATFREIYDDWRAGTRKIQFTQNIGIDRLRTYSSRAYPGWNMRIPDNLRMDVFLAELAQAERSGFWPNLVLLFLPNDHTTGTAPGAPTPQAQVADNDLALGRAVEALTRSRFWPRTCIFVVEDDPQDGFDHVDGHRSPCLVISPYTRRGIVVSRFYNQTSVLHTMERILGLPPMNQMDAMAPLMRECFTAYPALRPYVCRPNRIPLDRMNPPLSALTGNARRHAEQSARQDWSRPDLD